MTSYRLIIGILVGITLSFFTVFFFNMMVIVDQIKLLSGTNLTKIASLLIGANFDFDMISFFSGSPSILGFFAPEFLAWIFIGYITGTIAKGLKRGTIASILVVIVVLLIWIILSIISGQDLMALFQGTQLTETLGGIISALVGVLLGGSVGGLVSGPYEEFY
ncbi:MAG: hypothetical protein CEE43_05940 [Promethearchaeota archaeon Loki_b32]|nr:MAG: hypothetical protein CEE43_05940 [Candidatus Lokiarchaeota archaeon Loki_b32]